MFRVVRFRFGATIRARVAGLLTIAVLVALLGGLAMAALAGARRTVSSFPSFLANTNPSDLSALDVSADSGTSALHVMARLRHVRHVETAEFLNTLTLGSNGAPVGGASSLGAGGLFAIGSVDGLYFNQDRVTAVDGRLANPDRVDEVVMSADAARLTGARVGQTSTVGFYTNAESNSPAYGTSTIKPVRRFAVKLVGIVVFNNAVVQDDVDRSPTYVLFTPALTRQILRCCTSGLLQGLQLDHGGRDSAAVEAEIGRTPFTLSANTSILEAKAERAIKPEGIALGLFGLITVLATLVIAGQVIGRQLRAGADDLDVLRALGATRAMTTVDGLFGIFAAIITGSFLAAGLAIGLSLLAPIGPVRRVVRSRDIAFDWTVLGTGVLVLVVGLGAIAVARAYRRAPHRTARQRSVTTRGSRIARAAAASPLPPPSVTGISFAVESRRGRDSAPVRSAIVGATLAVVIVVGTLTFGASLANLVSHPALYGWNWNYELVSGYGGVSNIPQGTASRLLGRDRDVAAWNGIYLSVVALDGEPVPALAMDPHAAVAPPQLSGHGVDAPNEVVVGASTLAQLHKRVGDTIRLSTASTKPRELTIAGTSTLPAIGVFGNFHLEMSSGAIVADTVLPAAAKGLGRHDGPEGILVRLRPGANPTTALHALRKIADALNAPGDGPASIASLQRPAEIVNYRTMGNTPTYLGAALAIGAIVALALALIASVRLRRRDLALLKTLGFTRRQLAAVVAWQSSVAVITGIIVGMPLGIVLGRALWNRFAHDIHVVPQPTVPAFTLALIAIGALVLANLVAVVPAIQAARTRTAVLLRSE